MSQQADMFEAVSAEVVLARFNIALPTYQERICYRDVSRRLVWLRRQKQFDQLRELAIAAAPFWGFAGEGWLKLYAPDVLAAKH